jgi:hypothetical protein
VEEKRDPAEATVEEEAAMEGEAAEDIAEEAEVEAEDTAVAAVVAVMVGAEDMAAAVRAVEEASNVIEAQCQ